jgi:hypothetical protein
VSPLLFEPAGAFAYEDTDVPPGMTLDEWRRLQMPDNPGPRTVRRLLARLVGFRSR